MTETTATRSAVIALRDERRAMREGCAFLDEKCLLLAAEMVATLRRIAAIDAQAAPLRRRAAEALMGALARHGLNGLQCQPALDVRARSLAMVRRPLLGVALVDAGLEGDVADAEPAANPSPEARECAHAHAALARALVPRAALTANLARLHSEYRRTARRVRALEDVLLPELEREMQEMESTLEENEQYEALWSRFGRRTRA